MKHADLSFYTLCIVLILAGFVARADDLTAADLNTNHEGEILEPRIVPDDHHYPSLIRVTALAQIAVPDGPPRRAGGGAQATVEFGQRLISGEIGLAYLSARTNLHVTDSSGLGKTSYSHVDRYVGVPIFLKINYIERPQNSVSLKLGVMPIVSIKDTRKLDVGDSAGQPYDLKRSDTLAVIGFTGAAAMGDKTEFILDGSYGRGLTDLDGNGSHHGVLEIGLGVRFDL